MRVTAGDVEINVEVRGENCEGEPVVFLHGVGGDATNWTPQLEALSGLYQMAAIDTRGHGASEVTGEDLTLEDYAEDVRRTLDVLEIDRAHVVGLSMGGMIAQALVLHAPERVASLVLADTSARADADTAGNLSAAGEAALGYGMAAVSDQFLPACFCPAAIEGNRDYVLRFREGFSSRDPHAFYTALQAITGLDFLDRLGEVAVPTLVIVGSGDMLLPAQHSEVITERIPGARLVVLDGAGHLSNLDNQDEFTQALTDFFKETA